jgi:hypothetical protein
MNLNDYDVHTNRFHTSSIGTTLATDPVAQLVESNPYAVVLTDPRHAIAADQLRTGTGIQTAPTYVQAHSPFRRMNAMYIRHASPESCAAQMVRVHGKTISCRTVLYTRD